MRSKFILTAVAGMAAGAALSGHFPSGIRTADRPEGENAGRNAVERLRTNLSAPLHPGIDPARSAVVERSESPRPRPRPGPDLAPDLAPEKANALGIRPEILEDAGKLAADLEANREQHLAGMRNPAYLDQSVSREDPSRKLALRLGLDPEATKKAAAVIRAHRVQQIQRLLDAEQKRLDREGGLMARDREGYVNYLALQSMAGSGATLTKEQREFSEGIRSQLEPSDTVSPPVTTEWHDDAALVEALQAELTAEQQAGLAEYVKEQQQRAEETQALHSQMRSNRIAERLGLDEADRAALQEYLEQNPGATHMDISGILAPELVDLLPEGM